MNDSARDENGTPRRGGILGYFENMRFRSLVILGLILLAVDLFIPDPIPFVDELLIGIITLILSRFKRDRKKRNHQSPKAETLPHTSPHTSTDQQSQ